jgi:hypothetical protein
MKSPRSMLESLKNRFRDLNIPDEKSESVQLSEEEVLQDLLHHNISDRLLGRFSVEQVAAALKNYGVLQQLKEKGFPKPRILIRSIDPFRQTLKILTSPDASEEDSNLLCELRLFDTWLKNPAQEELPELEFDALVIDWLLFQNPRESFSPDRPRLPGQQYPGLGIMRTAMSAILDFAKQIGKEAVVNIPEYYHNALLYWPAFRFFSPNAEGEFCAARNLLSSLSLAQASHAFESGKICDQKTNEPVTWQPHEQGMGLSPRVTDYFQSPAYLHKVAAAEKDCRLRLV